MTEIASTDWSGRWGTSCSENTAIFGYKLMVCTLRFLLEFRKFVAFSPERVGHYDYLSFCTYLRVKVGF